MAGDLPLDRQWQAVAHGPEAGFQNWSGSLRFRPSRLEVPETEKDVTDIVRQARRLGGTVRPLGAGHSSAPIYVTDDVLVTLHRLAGLREYDSELHQAVLGAGNDLREMGKALKEVGLAMLNYGDVATQTIAGAIGTGTHGSGIDLQNLSMSLIGGRLVTGTGEVLAFAADTDLDLVRALRVSFGTLGILTEVRLQLQPDYQLRRQEWGIDFESFWPRLDTLANQNRNFDFYWYPRSDTIKFRCLNPPCDCQDYSAFAQAGEDRMGSPHEIIPKHSDLPDKFEEMEYALPAENGQACFLAVRDRIRVRWRRTVGWRLLYRFIKADCSWLSEAYGRPTVTISLHQNSSLPFRDYFADIEGIFQDHGGRPHWAKIHSMKATDLAVRYPKWRDFLDLRARLDPDGVFLTPYLRALLGVERR